MQPNQSSRIDLGDLKAQIVKKLGADRSKQYFYYLHKFFSQKVSKNEFDKLCSCLLGRENIQLHNQLIRSILKNAFQAKTLPPIQVSKSFAQASNSSLPREDNKHEQCGAGFPNQNQNMPIWSNGVLPMSPRKGRSGIRDRKLRDRPSPLGPNGKVDSMSHQLMTCLEDSTKVIMENGDVTNFVDYQRPIQHLQSVAELPENEMEGTVHSPAKKLRVHSNLLEGEDEVGLEDQSNHSSFLRSCLIAPLGIPFCSATVGGARKSSAGNMAVGGGGSYYDSGGLSDTESLRKRMEQIAAAQGLEGGVSVDCANMLNGMVDVYLKKLIRSCVDLVGSRSCISEQKRHPAQEQQIQGKVVNGLWPSNSGPPQQRQECSVSWLDFKVAMELDPKQLGEDWPLILEKISMQEFEE